MNFKTLTIVLASLIVGMIGFTLERLISSYAKSRQDINKNSTNISINKTEIDHIKDEKK